MAARSEDAAAIGRVVSARPPIREIVAIIGAMFATAGVLIAGMQWAVSNNVGPLFLAMQSLESHVLSIRDDVDVLRVDVGVLRGEVGGLRTEFGVLRTEVGKLPTEVAENRGQITDVRERVARVETGLELVQANQVRMLDILERGPPPRG